MKSSEPDDPFWWINLPTKVLDSIISSLAKVGIDISPVFMQVILLVAAVGILMFHLQRSQRQRLFRDVPHLLGLIGCSVISLTIASHWLIEFISPLPEEVGGCIKFRDQQALNSFEGMCVYILDFRDNDITVVTGIVDTQSGCFAAYYGRSIGNRPKFLKIEGQSQSWKVAIPLNRLRAGNNLDIFLGER